MNSDNSPKPMDADLASTQSGGQMTLSASGAARSKNERWLQGLERARQRYRKGEYAEAAQELSDLLSRLDPEFFAAAPPRAQDQGEVELRLLQAAALSLLGRAQTAQHLPDQAAQSLEAAVATFATWLSPQGPGQERLLAIWQAIGTFFSAKQSRNTAFDAQSYSDYGVALYLLGRVDEAVTPLEQAYEQGSNDPETYLYLGILKQKYGANAEAETLLRRALARAPEDPRILEALADAISAQTAVEDAIEFYEEATEMLAARGEWDETLRVAEHALQVVGGQNVYLLTRKADVLRIQEQFPAALSELERALQIDPNYDWALAVKGEVLRQQGHLDGARTALEQALAITPDYTFALEALGQVLHSLRDYEAAITRFQRAAELRPQTGRFFVRWAITLNSLSRYQDALEVLAHVARNDPDYAWAAARRAESLRMLDRLDQALAAVDEALAIVPGYAWALSVKGETLRQLERYDEAIPILQEAIEIEPDDAWTLAKLGEIYRLLRQYEEALTYFERALALSPNYTWALSSKGESLRMLGRLDEALAALELCLTIDPGDSWALTSKGATLRMADRNDEALAALDRALESNPDSSWALSQKGATLLNLKRYAEAVEFCDRSLAIAPHDAWVLRNKGDALRLSEKYTEALKCYEEAREIEPDSSWGQAIVAETLRLLKRYKEALAPARRATEIDPKYAVAWAILGQIQCALDHYVDGLSNLDRALAINAEDGWTWEVKGGALYEIAEYPGALYAFEQSLQRDKGSEYALRAKGWTLLQLGADYDADYLHKAQQAFVAALAIEPKSLYAANGLADGFLRQGEQEQARTHYRQLLEQVNAKAELDADLLSLAGWCHYRLGEYDEALRRMADALTRSTFDMEYLQLNVALVTLCSKRFARALREYGRGLELTRQRDPLRQRGILRDALHDLQEAPTTAPQITTATETEAARQLLQAAYDAVVRQHPYQSAKQEQTP